MSEKVQPRVQPGKPKKPWPAFPLTPHPSGQWCKKIRGKLYYFGAWADPDAAHQRYLQAAEKLHAGRTVAEDPDRVTVKEICNRFLAFKLAQSQEGKIVRSWYAAYQQAAGRFCKHVGESMLVSELAPDHFTSFLASRGGKGINKTVQCVRTIFNHAAGEQWCKPVATGKQFKKLPRSSDRARRPLLFSADECKRMIGSAQGQMLAMVLLGINGGMGQTDLATLRAGDVGGGVIDYRRQKTGVARTIPLWPQTVSAIAPFLAGKDREDLVFITAHAKPWVREVQSKNGKVSTIDSISLQFGKLLAKIGVRPESGKSDGRGFYTLRRTFRTLADAHGDQRAIDRVMGHAASASDMGAVYVQTIDRARLVAVVEHVRKSIFSKRTSRR